MSSFWPLHLKITFGDKNPVFPNDVNAGNIIRGGISLNLEYTGQGILVGA